MQAEDAGPVEPGFHLGGSLGSTGVFVQTMQDEFKIGGEFLAVAIGGPTGLNRRFQAPFDHGEVTAIDLEGRGGSQAIGQGGPAYHRLFQIRLEDLADGGFARGEA